MTSVPIYSGMPIRHYGQRKFGDNHRDDQCIHLDHESITIRIMTHVNKTLFRHLFAIVPPTDNNCVRFVPERNNLFTHAAPQIQKIRRVIAPALIISADSLPN